MAHSLSAKKRIRQNQKRRMLNRSRRSTLRSRLRRCQDLFLHGSVEDTEQAVRAAIRYLDRESDRRLLHRNAAARQKSRLMRKLNEMKAKTAAS